MQRKQFYSSIINPVFDVSRHLHKKLGSLIHIKREMMVSAQKHEAFDVNQANNCERKHHIVLIGAIANPNVGDEAILYHALSHIDKVFGRGASVNILSQNAQYTKQFLHLHSCQANASDALRTLTARFPQDLDALMVTEANIINRLKGANCFRNTDAETLRLYDEVIAQFDNIDILHVIGGGYMNSMWPHMFFEVHVATRIAKEKNARVILTGQSMIPLDVKNHAHIKLLHDIVSSAIFCDFRDNSIQVVEQAVPNANLMRTVDDLALHVESLPTNKKDNTEAYGNITLVGLLGSATAEEHLKAHEHILGVLSSFLSTEFQEGRIHHVNLLSFSPGDEFLLNELIKTSTYDLRLITLYDSPSTDAFIIVQEARWNIGERFHHAVFSMAAGIPSMSWWHNDYYKNKMISSYQAWNLANSSMCMPQDEVSVEKLVFFASDEGLHITIEALSSGKKDVLDHYLCKKKALMQAYEP